MKLYDKLRDYIITIVFLFIYEFCQPYNYCKTINLVNTLGWLKEIFSVNKKSHMIHQILILQIFGAPKKLHFWLNHNKMLNWLNSANGAEIHKGHIKGLQREATCRGWVKSFARRGNASWPGWFAFTNRQNLIVRTLWELNIDVSW